MGPTLRGVLSSLALGVVLCATAGPLEASCANFAPLSSIPLVGPRSYIWTEELFEPTYDFPPYVLDYTPPFSPAIRGVWWRLGTGNPDLGAGDDSGNFNFIAANDLYFYGPGAYGSYFGGNFFSGWGASFSIDGCIGPGNCTCLLFVDVTADDTFLALVGARANLSESTEFDLPGSDGSGNAAPIILRKLDKPTIVHTERNPDTLDLDLIAVKVGPPRGIYDTGPCACAEGASFRIYGMLLPRGSPPPDSRNLSSGWALMKTAAGTDQPSTLVGKGVALRSACGASDHDLYLAALIEFNTVERGSEPFTSMLRVSSNSTRIECGPNAVELPERPEEPRRPRAVRPRGKRRR
ncbi:MAG: hypothetical protein GY716_07710 [bacterium]|nr:hypothetical protein [bacterium]